jgi:uncharacterized protein (DUF488 family)
VKLIMTIGHGTRSLDELVAVLRAHGVTRLVDVRKMPRSRANPQFNFETLPGALERAGIAYVHMGGLTGLRKRAKDSPNTAWRNKSFQGYADHMQTPEFRDDLGRLATLAAGRDTAVMCAETLPWRCHRSLIADALVARGIAVLHLLSPSKASVHALPDFAVVRGARVTYPAPPTGPG